MLLEDEGIGVGLSMTGACAIRQSTECFSVLLVELGEEWVVRSLAASAGGVALSILLRLIPSRPWWLSINPSGYSSVSRVAFVDFSSLTGP